MLLVITLTQRQFFRTVLSQLNKPKKKNTLKWGVPLLLLLLLQALTTGSIPGFIDVVMNLNSPALLEDNLLWQAKAAGKRMIFYGDDTWLRLFPKLFMERDGTTSFFVSDYTEVRVGRSSGPVYTEGKRRYFH